MLHLINWVEIPVSDMKRAHNFYKKILGVEIQEMDLGPFRYGLFPCVDKFNCGALVQGEYYTPSADGVTVYLDGGSDLNIILEKVKVAGGTVLMEKTFLSKEAGYMGVFLDSEGNKIGLQHM